MNDATVAAKPEVKNPAARPPSKTRVWATRVAEFFKDAPVVERGGGSVKEDRARFRSISRTVQKRSIIIVVLILLNIALAPFLKPQYQYIAVLDAQKEKKLMVGLFEPNQTDQAVLSWAATSITEIMTFGFGDIDQRLLSQRHRFTSDGWDSFIEALRKNDLREGFKMRQLVLTTVPTDSPVIVSKGHPKSKEGVVDEDSYEWIVEMPIILTYVTNNNVSSGSKGIIRLTITRVPSRENPAGIGIKIWQFV